MKRFEAMGVAACALMALVSCAPPEAAKAPATATDDDVRAMRAATKARSEALAAGDLEKYLGVYQDDAVLLPPHAAEIVGKAHIKERLEEALKEVAIEPASESREYEILGPAWIAERGRFSWTVTPKEKGEPSQDSGNFMILWHKAQDGSWKISWEMWTSSRPLVEPKAK